MLARAILAFAGGWSSSASRCAGASPVEGCATLGSGWRKACACGAWVCQGHGTGPPPGQAHPPVLPSDALEACRPQSGRRSRGACGRRRWVGAVPRRPELFRRGGISLVFCAAHGCQRPVGFRSWLFGACDLHPCVVGFNVGGWSCFRRRGSLPGVPPARCRSLALQTARCRRRLLHVACRRRFRCAPWPWCCRPC